MKAFIQIALSLSFLASCSGGNFSGGPALQPPKDEPQTGANPPADPGTPGTPGDVPPGTTPPAGPTPGIGGGGTNLTEISFAAGVKIDGVTTIFLDKSTGKVSFQSIGDYKLAYLPITIGQHVTKIPNFSSGIIDGYVAPADLTKYGFILRKTSYGPEKRSNPADIKINNRGTIISIKIDDGKGGRGGQVILDLIYGPCGDQC
jgi:hypothetical protein